MKNTGEAGFSLKLTAWMEKISAKKAKSVLAVSQNCKNELIELYGIPESKIISRNTQCGLSKIISTEREKVSNFC